MQIKFFLRKTLILFHTKNFKSKVKKEKIKRQKKRIEE
jgi:hypothetical protein